MVARVQVAAVLAMAVGLGCAIGHVSRRCPSPGPPATGPERPSGVAAPPSPRAISREQDPWRAELQRERVAQLLNVNRTLDAVASDLARRVDELERELARTNSASLPDRHLPARPEGDARGQGIGVPYQWPTADGTPEHLRADKMRERLESVTERCDLGGDLLSVDCSEPPCMAAFRVRDRELRAQLLACPAWSEVQTAWRCAD